MRALGLAAIALLWASFPATAEISCPVPEDGVIHVATFNVYRLGNIAEKYTAESEEDAAAMEIPERVKNLARVLAAGPV